jgi:hypothetical protein
MTSMVNLAMVSFTSTGKPVNNVCWNVGITANYRVICLRFNLLVQPGWYLSFTIGFFLLLQDRWVSPP